MDTKKAKTIPSERIMRKFPPNGWTLDNTKKVWCAYRSLGRAEVTARRVQIPGDRSEGLFAMKVWMNGEKQELGGFPEIEQAMRCCEDKLKGELSPIVIGKLSLIIALIVMFCMNPPLFLSIYSLMSYLVIALMIYRGDILEENPPKTDILVKRIENVIVWLASPLFFGFMVVFFGMKFKD